ncbi:uncharacterized protein LOC117109962 [Anneissia japonica]|uniref:uncharacterized protein LOC117109962 n=1 Tax=Anneissia japonica TaxID=1529436 RepID=UPI00142557CE|nr:uncharacterized protein LOC117109962 [Anneissia japonica]
MSANRYETSESIMPLLGHAPVVHQTRYTLGRIKTFIIIAVIKILQIGRSTYHRPRLCHRCSPCDDSALHELIRLNASYDDHTSLQTTCVVCESLNWGEMGQVIPMDVTIRPHGVTRRCWCWAVSVFGFLYLSLVFVLILYDAGVYFNLCWGEKSELLFLVSYNTYILQLIVVPFICIWGRFQPNYFFHEGYIRDRLRFLMPGLHNISMLALVICSLWPLSCACLRFGYDISWVYPLPKAEVVHRVIGRGTAIVGYVMYGCFCIIIYVIKCSLTHECRLVVKFVCIDSTSLNSCRKRTDEMFRDFKKFRDFTNKWLLFSASIGLIGIFCQITWNYHMNKEYMGNLYRIHSVLWNVLIWDQKIMFAVLPFICVGGLNVEYLWHKLVYDMSMLRITEREKYWKKVIKHVKSLNFEARKPDMMFLFTLCSVYMGLQLTTNQDLRIVTLLSNVSMSLPGQNNT